VPVGPRAVTADLAADRRAVAPHGAGDLCLVQALPSERGEHIPLLGGELSISHGEDLFLAVEVFVSIATHLHVREVCCTQYMNPRGLTTAFTRPATRILSCFSKDVGGRVMPGVRLLPSI
jgi:hypothetical protein